VFRRQSEIVAEHNSWSKRDKSTYLIKALKGRAADVLPGISTNTTYENTFQALEDRFGDQHFAVAYRYQVRTRTQMAGESLQAFATALEVLEHRTYPTLPENHIGREAGKTFAYRVHDPDKNSTAARTRMDSLAITLIQYRQEVPVRVLNATHHDQKLTRRSPLAQCEPGTLVTERDLELQLDQESSSKLQNVTETEKPHLSNG
jgi:hypothetical protein